MVKLSLLFLYAWFLTFSGCSDWRKPLDFNQAPEAKAATIEIPADESTPQERAYISKVRSRIAKIAQELGYKGEFDSIPILVTSENPLAQRREGYCLFDPDGHSVFIAINRSVLNADQPPLRASKTFGVLLHEIGHCYFHREHGSEILKRDGTLIVFQEEDSQGGSQWTLGEFSVSVMRDYSLGAAQDFGLFIPHQLEKYYVAEVMGLDKIKTLEELETRFGAKLYQAGTSLGVPWTEPSAQPSALKQK